MRNFVPEPPSFVRILQYEPEAFALDIFLYRRWLTLYAMVAPKVARWKRITESAKINLASEHQHKLTQILSWHGRMKLCAVNVMNGLQMTECCTFVHPEDGTMQGRIVYEGSVTQIDDLAWW